MIIKQITDIMPEKTCYSVIEYEFLSFFFLLLFKDFSQWICRKVCKPISVMIFGTKMEMLIEEKLEKFNPPTLQAASQISGITPAAIEILHIYIKINSKS